jgi:hypothetical protein
MPRPIQRLTDSNSGGGKVANTDGNTTVYSNNLLTSVNTSLVRYSPGTTSTANGSGVVFAHNKPVNYTDNPDADGKVRIGGSGNVFVGDDIDQDIPSTRAVIGGDEEEANTKPASRGGPPAGRGPGSTYFSSKAKSGTIDAREVEREGAVKATGKASGGATKNKAPATTSAGDVGDVFPDTLQLSPNFTIGKLTRKPNVVFDHPVSAPNVLGLPTKTIVENLKLLAINTLEPIRAKYPNAFITNTFREDSKSQHGKGQAADIQFRGVGKAEYYNIAIWIRDNVPFDQLLLEYKTTGSGLPWIHISFAVPQRPPKDPTKVMTFLNDKRETKTAANGYGLVQLAEG